MCEKIIEKIRDRKCFFIMPVLAVLLLGFLAGKYIGKSPETPNTISFTGTSEVFVKPDLATITFSVQNEAKTVAEAMAENTQRMNAVIDSVKSQGVEDRDLKTASFNISPRYEWRKDGEERILVGYDVYQSLQVKIRNLEKVGLVIQSATEMGANDASGLQFTVENEDTMKSPEAIKSYEKVNKKYDLRNPGFINFQKFLII